MESFHEEYSNATKYLYGEAHLKELDAKYLPDEWIQMFLDKEVPIENADDYWAYIYHCGEGWLTLKISPKNGHPGSMEFHPQMILIPIKWHL